MPHLTERDRLRRKRFAAFLRPLVGRAPAVTITSLDRTVAELTGRSGDARGEWYAYLNENQTVKESRAFWCGEALRHLGISWCSGPTGLYAAGYLSEWARVLASLCWRRGSVAPAFLAVYTPFAVLANSEVRESVAGASTAVCAAARQRLERLLSRYTESDMKWAFVADEALFRASNELFLGPIVDFARTSADPFLVESVVLTALSEWAVRKTKGEVRETLARDSLAYQALRIKRIVKSAAEIDALVDQIRALEVHA